MAAQSAHRPLKTAIGMYSKEKSGMLYFPMDGAGASGGRGPVAVTAIPTPLSARRRASRNPASLDSRLEVGSPVQRFPLAPFGGQAEPGAGFDPILGHARTDQMEQRQAGRAGAWTWEGGLAQQVGGPPVRAGQGRGSVVSISTTDEGQARRQEGRQCGGESCQGRQDGRRAASCRRQVLEARDRLPSG